MAKQSSPTDLFLNVWSLYLDSIPLEPEYRFAAHYVGLGKGLRERLKVHRLHDWRFDFAIPYMRVAIEIEGGTFVNGRHTRAKGFAGDCSKYNAAVRLGWRVLRYTTDMLNENPYQVIEDVRALLRKG